MVEEHEFRYFRGLDLQSLKIDEAFVNVTSLLAESAYIYLLNDNCYKCPFQLHDADPSP